MKSLFHLFAIVLLILSCANPSSVWASQKVAQVINVTFESLPKLSDKKRLILAELKRRVSTSAGAEGTLFIKKQEVAFSNIEDKAGVRSCTACWEKGSQVRSLSLQYNTSTKKYTLLRSQSNSVNVPVEKTSLTEEQLGHLIEVTGCCN